MMGILEFIVFAIMSRILSREEFGLYAILQSMIMIFKPLSEAGLGASIIQNKSADQGFINTCFTLSIIFGIIFSIFAICLSHPISNFYGCTHLIIPFIFIAISLIPYSLNSIFRSLLFKKLKFLKYGIYQILAYLIGNVVGIIMAINGYGVYSLVIANLFYIIGQTAILYFNSCKKIKIQINRQNVKEILSFGGWLTITRILTQIYTQIDKLIIGKLLSISILGIFYRIRGFIDSVDSQIGGVFDVVLFPILSKIQDDKVALQRAYVKSIFFCCIFFSFLFLTFIFNSRLIIIIVLGDKWIDQILLFRILSISMLMYSLSRINDCFIRSLAFLKFAFNLKFFSIALLVSLIFWFVNFGTTGVACAICGTNLIICIIKTIYICRYISLPVYFVFNNIIRSLRYSIPLVTTGAVYWSLNEPTVTNDIIFAIIFCLLSLLIFLFAPKFVGQQYEEIIHSKIKHRLLIR